jgi:phosphorylated adapter RNA export protein
MQRLEQRANNGTIGSFLMKAAVSSEDEESDDEGPLPAKRAALHDPEDKPSTAVKSDLKSNKPSPRLNIRDGDTTVQAKKRFSIWSDVLLEQQLTEDMQSSMKVGTESKTRKRDRNVENYDFWKKDEGTGSQKGIFGVKKSGLFRGKNSSSGPSISEPMFRCPPSSGSNSPSNSRGPSSSDSNKRKRKRENKKRRQRTPEEKITEQIATKLNEPKVDLMRKTVAVLGCDLAMKICNQVLDIESAGGMKTNDGKRRRSPGGVYLYLLKGDKRVTKEQVTNIFGQEKQGQEEKRKLKRKARRRLQKVVEAEAATAATAQAMDKKEIETGLESIDLEGPVPVSVENEARIMTSVPMTEPQFSEQCLNTIDDDLEEGELM